MSTYDAYRTVEGMTFDNQRLVHLVRGSIYSTEMLTEAKTLALTIALIYNIGNLFEIKQEASKVTVDGITPIVDESNDMLLDVLEKAGLVDENNRESDKLLEMFLATEKSHPAPATQEIRRKRSWNGAGLVTKAVSILEKTEFVVDEQMLAIALEVDKSVTKDETYILEGCLKLVDDGNVPLHSEFFPDSRGRFNTADYHGPVGAASDMARSVQDLHGVSMNYDVKMVIPIIRAEMEDMISISLRDAVKLLKSFKNEAQFITYVKLSKKEKVDVGIKKPWSFVKAVLLMRALQQGKKPYIGMAFGYDAKCSGPQLGALLTGDAKLASACGFNDDSIDVGDAYEIAIQSCEEAGVYGFKRASIKKAYMEVFYGLAAMSFTDPDYVKSHDHAQEVVDIIKTIMVEGVPEEDEFDEQAQVFHRAVERSFGKLQGLRNVIKEAHIKYYDNGVPVFRTSSATVYKAPDGFVINTNYKKLKTIDGIVVTYNTDIPDVSIEYDGKVALFEKLSFRTNEVSLGDFARTGFVNFIQGGDAFLARLIIKKLDILKVKHIICIHDCFRVSITDMCNGKLTKGIQWAYDDFLTSGDAIKLYFDGVKRAGSDLVVNAQSIEAGRPIIEKSLDYKGLVKLLGKGATFFDK